MIKKFAVPNVIKVGPWGLHPEEWWVKICAKQNTSRCSSFEFPL